MGQPTSNSSWIAGQIFRVTIAWAVCIFVTITAGCSASTEQRLTAESPNARPAEVPDESQLQVPPLRFTGLEPADPQPADDAIRPGLAVTYYFKFFERHLDALSAFAASPANLRQTGKPILYLNHRFGKEEVFDSGTNRGVAMRMKGLIRFPQAGEYTFRAISNDGLRIRIDDVMIIDDPTQHADRYAVQAVVSIRQAGWYPLTVAYFQRKGTASIALFWRRPEAKDFAPVPAGSYAHLP